jgi:hypothetical protein
MNRLTDLILHSIENKAIRPINIFVLRQIVANALSNLFNYRFLEESNMTFADALSAMADILVFGLLPAKE